MQKKRPQTEIIKAIDLGKHQATIEMAKLLKDLGKTTLDEIMTVTGLSKDQIDNL